MAKTVFTGTLAIILVLGCSSEKEAGNPGSGRAPLFSLKDLRGNTVRLEDLRGKVVLLNFFATWCAPCRQEIPDFVQFHKKFKDKGLEIVGVSLDMEGGAHLNAFANHYGITYPIVMGTRKMVFHYGDIKGITNSYVIDRNGMIV